MAPLDVWNKVPQSLPCPWKGWCGLYLSTCLTPSSPIILAGFSLVTLTCISPSTRPQDICMCWVFCLLLSLVSPISKVKALSQKPSLSPPTKRFLLEISAAEPFLLPCWQLWTAAAILCLWLFLSFGYLVRILRPSTVSQKTQMKEGSLVCLAIDTSSCVWHTVGIQ